MTKIVIAFAALLGTPVFAQTPPPAPGPGHVAAQTQTTTATATSKPAIGAPKVTTKVTAKTTAVANTGGRIVAVQTKTGRTVHYDCSKAGNKNKTACKS